MYYSRQKASDFWHELSLLSESAIDSIPTFERQLDSFFDRNAGFIIDEWGLVTDDDLRYLRMKLDYLSYEAGRLVVEKSNIEKRTIAIRAALDDLEENR